MADNLDKTKTPRADALRLANEFIANPDERAQVKVQLAANGWPQLATMIDEAVQVSRALIDSETELAAALARLEAAEKDARRLEFAEERLVYVRRKVGEIALSAATSRVDPPMTIIDWEKKCDQIMELADHLYNVALDTFILKGDIDTAHEVEHGQT